MTGKRDETMGKTGGDGRRRFRAVEVEIPLEGRGGEVGIKAVKNLIALMNGLKQSKTVEELETNTYMICGYMACCELCGFLSQKSVSDMVDLLEHIGKNEKIRLGKK